MTTEGHKPPAAHHRAVVLVAAATALSLLGDQALYAILPTMYRSLGLTYFQVGVLLSVNRWIRLLTNHLAERLIHRVNSTALFLAALVLGAALTALYGFWPIFPALLAARILWGLSWSVINQIGIMTCVDAGPAGNAARTMGSYSGLSRVGSIAGMFAGAYLFDLLGFGHSFVILGAVTLLAVLPGATARRSLDSHPSEYRRPRGKAFSNHTVGLLACGLLVSCAGTGVIESTLGYVLKRRLGEQLPIGSIVIGIATFNGLVLASRHVINLLGAPALGGLADRIGHRKGTVIFFCITTAILAAAAVAPSVWILLCLVVMLFVCLTCLHVVLATEAGGCGSRMFAWFASASDLGAALGPLAIWPLLKAFPSPSAPFVIAAGLSLAGAGAALLRLRQAGAAGREPVK